MSGRKSLCEFDLYGGATKHGGCSFFENLLLMQGKNKYCELFEIDPFKLLQA